MEIHFFYKFHKSYIFCCTAFLAILKWHRQAQAQGGSTGHALTVPDRLNQNMPAKAGYGRLEPAQPRPKYSI